MIPLSYVKSTYEKRRRRLAENLVPNRDLVVFFTAPHVIRNYDAHFAHRPDSSFLYLTGYAEPEAAFLLWREKKGARVETKFALFVLPRDRALEQWNGYRYGPQRAGRMTDADEAGEISQLGPTILKWLHAVPDAGVGPRIYSNAADYAEHDEFLRKTVKEFSPRLRAHKFPLEGIFNSWHLVAPMRTIKDKEELATMRKSSRINVAAHLKLWEALKPGMTEYEAQAILEGEWMRQGCRAPAYNTISASGPNATVLHYNFNNRTMKEGELLLVDAGCEYDFYASDITRTWPVGGRYSDEQRAIVQLVGEAHAEVLAIAKKGTPYASLHAKACEVLNAGLVDLGILKGSKKENLAEKKFFRYYPHGTGHWLGLDVHDPCPYVDAKARPLKLEPGMVFTIEPGLYFMEDDDTVDEKWRGIGVRIEDDVVVTSGKAEILTAGLPRYADEIERRVTRAKPDASARS